MRGSAGDITWDLSFAGGGERPVYTFGRTVWERHLLPGAQCVPWPSAAFRGTIRGAGEVSAEVDARGALARIYGHSNAHRWCWLHASLGDGEVLELVAATARRPGLRRLAPMAMVQLRLPGVPDAPRVPMLAGPLLRTRFHREGFTVSGLMPGRHPRRLHIEAAIPAERSVTLTYTDPDGSTAVCTNSEVSSVTVSLRDVGRRRSAERRWEITGSAHAEIGRRL